MFICSTKLFKSVFPSLIQTSLHKKCFYSVSGRKFHEVVTKIQPKQILHTIPEDNILTKYLQSQNTSKPQTNKQFNQMFTKKSKNAIIQTKSKKVNYKQILAENSRGSILNKSYKNAELCLIGMNYSNVSYDNLYRSMLKFQPDCIISQVKPEHFCKNFEIIKQNPENDIFSDKLYIQQLQLDKNFNLKQNFTEEDIKRLQSYIFPRKSINNKSSLNTDRVNEYFPLLNYEIVGQRPLMTSIYNFLKKNIPVFLGQLPESVYREWICNTHSLMELQQLFKITAKSLPLYSGVNLTPYQLAAYLFPEQFLAINDKYMATLVEIMIAKGYKRIMLLSGVAQNQGIWQILDNGYHTDQFGQINPLINYLVPQKVKGTIIRDYDPLQVIEKHILFDTMFYGNDVKNVKVSQFQTTNKIINCYAQKQPKQMIFQFRYEMCMKYSQMLQQCIEQGKQRKKKQFMRSVIRD